MLSNLSGSFADMDPTQRAELAAVVRLRIAYMRLSIALNERQLAVLQNPTPENEAALKEFATTQVAPARSRLVEQALKVVRSGIDAKGLEEELPMLALALTRHIDLNLVLAALGFDTDGIERAIGGVSSFIKRGLE